MEYILQFSELIKYIYYHFTFSIINFFKKTITKFNNRIIFDESAISLSKLSLNESNKLYHIRCFFNSILKKISQRH